MALSQDEIKELRSHIVCPLLLRIAVESEGRCGGILSYRCLPRAGGQIWETRPAKASQSQKGDKWRDDFLKVLNAKKDEKITLSDGETQMFGLDLPSDTRFEFRDEDGRRAKQAAIKFVLDGKLQAPRNWDEVFAKDAGRSKEQLQLMYPELYKSKTRTTTKTDDAEETTKVEDVPSADFFSDVIPSVTTPTPSSEEEEEEYEISDIPEMDEEYTEEEYGMPSHSASYSVEMLEELDTPEARDQYDVYWKYDERFPTVNLTKDVRSFTIDLAPDDSDREDPIQFYVVQHPVTGHKIILVEGENVDASNLYLNVEK